MGRISGRDTQVHIAFALHEVRVMPALNIHDLFKYLSVSSDAIHEPLEGFDGLLPLLLAFALDPSRENL
jgi:hypothetical protein